MIRKVFDHQEVPWLPQKIGFRDRHLVVSRDVRTPGRDMHAHPIDRFVDFCNAHEVMRQDRLHYLGDPVKHFTNVENIGQGIEQLIQNLHVRGQVLLAMRPV